MSWLSRNIFRVLVVALALTGWDQVANAQSSFNLSSLSSTSTTTWTFGSWSIVFNQLGGSETGCGFTGTGAPANCNDIKAVASVHRGLLDVIFQDITSPTESILTAATTGGEGSTTRTLTFHFNVIAPAVVSNTSFAVAGATSGSSTLLGQITGAETINDIYPLSTNAGSGSPASTIISPTLTTLNVDKTITVSTVASGSTLQLNTVTQVYTSAPEPISISLFGVGVGALVIVRRRPRQPSAAPRA